LNLDGVIKCYKPAYNWGAPPCMFDMFFGVGYKITPSLNW
jgi:hypothetical protein